MYFKVVTHTKLRDMCLVSELNDILTMSLVHNINFNENTSNAGQIWIPDTRTLCLPYWSISCKRREVDNTIVLQHDHESLTKGCVVSVSYSTLHNIVSQSGICLRDNGFQSRRKCQDPCFLWLVLIDQLGSDIIWKPDFKSKSKYQFRNAGQ